MSLFCNIFLVLQVPFQSIFFPSRKFKASIPILVFMVIHVNNAFQFIILIDYLLNYQAIPALALFTSKVSAKSLARYYL